MNTTLTQSEQQIPTLIENLGDTNGLTRQRARMMLIHLGSASVPALLQALQSDDEKVRLEAARSLREIRDPKTIPAFTDLLMNEDTSLRWVAMEALIYMGRASLRPVLEKFVKNFDSAYLREGVHHILHVFKDRYLLTDEEKDLFEKLDKKEIPGFDMGWNTEAAWAAEKALEAINLQTK